MKNFNKGIAPIVMILVIAGVLVLAGGGWYLYKKVNLAQNQQVIDETADWKIYKNDKGFEIKYPVADWQVEMRGEGAPITATPQAEVFTITKTDSTDSVSFDIAALGSDRLGNNYASAQNLSEYLNLLTKTDQSGKVIRKFIKITTIAGQEAYWYQTYEWSISKQMYDWDSQVYWQHGNDIYEVRIDPLANNVSNHILSTFKFISLSNGTNWKTYINDQYGFEIGYPSNYQLSDVIQKEGFYNYQISKIASFTIKGNNSFDSSSLSVYADNNNANVSACLTDYNGTNLTITKEINRNTFYVWPGSKNAAMGGARGLESQYHIIHDSYCYILYSKIYWHEVGYEGYINTGKNSATPKEIQIQNDAIKRNSDLLDQTLQTFKFTK